MLLNLAAVYGRTGRAAEARMLYQEVLGADDVLMDVSADRSVSAHRIAEAGLRRLAGSGARFAGN